MIFYAAAHHVPFCKNSLGSFPGHGLGDGVWYGDSLRLRQDPLRRGGPPGVEERWLQVGSAHGGQRRGAALPWRSRADAPLMLFGFGFSGTY